MSARGEMAFGLQQGLADELQAKRQLEWSSAPLTSGYSCNRRTAEQQGSQSSGNARLCRATRTPPLSERSQAERHVFVAACRTYMTVGPTHLRQRGAVLVIPLHLADRPVSNGVNERLTARPTFGIWSRIGMIALPAGLVRLLTDSSCCSAPQLQAVAKQCWISAHLNSRSSRSCQGSNRLDSTTSARCSRSFLQQRRRE